VIVNRRPKLKEGKEKKMAVRVQKRKKRFSGERGGFYMKNEG
jgi:hypothetical protein